MSEHADLPGRQARGEEEVAQIQQGLEALLAIGQSLARPHFLGLLAEAYGRLGQAEEGLLVLAEALAIVQRTEEHYYEAELYRLKGALTLHSQAHLEEVSGKSRASQDQSKDTEPRPLTSDSQGEAEVCFQQAIEIARKQQAKSWELRASTSLARLWQQQGKKDKARQVLADIYHWFTEGFDTKDLQEAKALLEELT